MARLGEMMIFNEEKDGESEWYAMIFIADLTPPPALCPCIHGSAVLKSDDKLSRKTKCQRYEDFDIKDTQKIAFLELGIVYVPVCLVSF